MILSSNSLHYYCLFLVSVFIFVSCDKDKVNDSNECDSLSFPDNFFGNVVYEEVGTQFKSPFFNPNNSNEFIYYEKNILTSEFNLKIYNIDNGQISTVTTNANINNQPKWSVNNWIAFDNLTTYQINIIKTNGDSLNTVSIDQAALFPVWSSNGNYLFWNHTPNLANSHILLRYDITSQNIDTVLSGFSFNNDISINDDLLSNTFDQNISFISTSNIDNWSFSFHIENPSSNILGLSWNHDGTGFFYSIYDAVEGGIFKYNLATGDSERITCSCNSSYYSEISCSNDGASLICERVDQELEYNNEGIFTGKVIMRSKIVLINLNDKSETVLIQ